MSWRITQNQKNSGVPLDPAHFSSIQKSRVAWNDFHKDRFLWMLIRVNLETIMVSGWSCHCTWVMSLSLSLPLSFFSPVAAQPGHTQTGSSGLNREACTDWGNKHYPLTPFSLFLHCWPLWGNPFVKFLCSISRLLCRWPPNSLLWKLCVAYPTHCIRRFLTSLLKVGV